MKDKYQIPVIDDLLDELHGEIISPNYIYRWGITKFVSNLMIYI